MANLFQYARGASGQSAGIITRPTTGLNEFLPSNSINDNLMSELIDVFPYRDECVMFQGIPSIVQLGATETTAKGLVRACIHADESNNGLEIFYLMTSLQGELWKLIRHVYDSATHTTTLAEFSFAYDFIVPSDPTLVDSSSAVFKTEVDTYYVFSNSCEKRLHFIKHGPASLTYGYVDVPAFPRKLVSHANRIFFIDTSNKIWWCKAGDLYSWYSLEYDPDAIVTERPCANATFGILGQPNTPRPITATVSKNGDIDTLGILTITGISPLDVAQTAILTLVEGRVQTSVSFKSITSIIQSGWVKGGTTADAIVVGVAPVGLGYVVDDAGFWTVDQELALHDICKLGASLYIFANHDIYIFQGYSPDNFSLTKIISDIGIDKMIKPNGYRKLAMGKNDSYFIYDGVVYDFDGNNQPRIISRPSVLNGQSINGIYGGINFSGETWVLSAIAESLCLYDYSGVTPYYYLYNFETKTWWKMSGVLKPDIGTSDAIKIMYIPSFDRQKWYTLLSVFSATNRYVLSESQGCTQNDVDPFMISKAYNTNPSETGSLTDVILLIKGERNSTANVTVEYSLSVDADDFTIIKRFDNFIFNGDLEIMFVPVPIGNIANAHHYRLKIIVSDISGSSPVYLYNIERRFRTKGRSR